MTIFSIVVIVLAAVITLIAVIACAYMAAAEKSPSYIAGAVIALIVGVSICAGIVWWSFNTESGKRAYKDQQSNLDGGIQRTVSVYDINGELIKEYSGKFDIETDEESYILFDDEDGHRHIIYYTTGTIIVDEE